MNTNLPVFIFSKLFSFLNNSKIFSGLIMIIMNLGSRYINIDIGSYIDKVLSNYFFRKIALFSVFWTATRDILISILLTLIFSFLMEFLFNDKSSLCIIPRKEIFLSKYKKVTNDEYERAKSIVNNYEKDKNSLEYFSKLYDFKQRKKENLYMMNKIRLKELRNTSKLRKI